MRGERTQAGREASGRIQATESRLCSGMLPCRDDNGPTKRVGEGRFASAALLGELSIGCAVAAVIARTLRSVSPDKATARGQAWVDCPSIRCSATSSTLHATRYDQSPHRLSADTENEHETQLPARDNDRGRRQGMPPSTGMQIRPGLRRWRDSTRASSQRAAEPLGCPCSSYSFRTTRQRYPAPSGRPSSAAPRGRR